MARLIDFEPIDPRHEWPHDYPDGVHYSLTETHYFGVQLLEPRLDCEIYAWYHPALRMVSAGIFCFSGFPLTHMACDYFDYQVYLPWPEVSDRSISFVNGLELIIEEPLQRILVRYSNEARNTSLDLAYTAVMPAVPRKRAMHNEAVQRVGYDVGGLEQTMRVEGEIRLGGQVIPVDTHFVRDRSYGQLRSEAAGSGPPFGWQSGSFGADFSFGILGIEDPKRNPCWADAFQVPPDRTLFSGWVCRDGGVYEVKRHSRLMRRGSNGLWPTGGNFEFEDSTGRRFEVESEVRAIQPWGPWPNMSLVWGLTEFRMQGRTGVGSTQEILLPDFSRRFLRSK